MKAVVISAPKKLAIIEKKTPLPGPEEALVRINYCGICGSDRHAFESGYLPDDMTIGHEFSGVVASLGKDCSGWQAGDHVTGNNIITCGRCDCCLAGQDNLCREMRRLGITDQGTMAEYAVIPVKTLVKLPSPVFLESAALTEPLSVALHAVNQANFDPAKPILILGGGTIGLLVLSLLKIGGAEEVYLVEPDPHKRLVAEKLGAVKALAPEGDMLEKEVLKLTGNRGVDQIFECAGLTSTIEAACSLAAPGSGIVICGIVYQPVELNFLSLVTREVRLISAFGKKNSEFRKAAEMISNGQIDITPLITNRIGYAQVERDFTEQAAGNVKTLLLF